MRSGVSLFTGRAEVAEWRWSETRDILSAERSIEKAKGGKPAGVSDSRLDVDRSGIFDFSDRGTGQLSQSDSSIISIDERAKLLA